MPPRKRKSEPDPIPAERRTAASSEGPPQETRVHEILPADDPPPPPLRRVGPRRVVGHDTAERLLARRAFRPAGNSRRFWAKVEADDPFLARPPSARGVDEAATLSVHEVPAAARADRTERPAKTVEPGAVDRRRKAESGPRAERPAEPPPRQEPARKHLPDPRAVPAPRPPPPRPAPEPEPEPPPPPVIDRRPPRIVDKPAASGPRIPVQPTVTRQLVNKEGKTATQVRQEAEQARSASKPESKMPPTRSLDDVLGILGSLAVSERLYREGRTAEATEAAPETRATPAKPPPKPAPKPPPATRAAPPPPDPGPPATPPRARPTESLDDLFGANEGRVKVGKRTVPKAARTDGEG